MPLGLHSSWTLDLVPIPTSRRVRLYNSVVLFWLEKGWQRATGGSGKTRGEKVRCQRGVRSRLTTLRFRSEGEDRCLETGYLSFPNTGTHALPIQTCRDAESDVFCIYRAFTAHLHNGAFIFECRSFGGGMTFRWLEYWLRVCCKIVREIRRWHTSCLLCKCVSVEFFDLETLIF